jgi:hypothetical protein
MKTTCVACVVILFFSSLLVGKGFAQSAQCVVSEVSGSLMTLVCPGVGTVVQSIGGTADRYKAGDTVNLPNQFNESTRPVAPDTRPAASDTRPGRR